MAPHFFIHRVLSSALNYVIVEGLSNSRAFQRFAVRTSIRLEGVSKLAAGKKIDLAEQMKDFSRDAVKMVLTTRRFEDVSKLAAEKKIDLAEQLKDFSRDAVKTFFNQKR